jgi:two-component sensor histidine kinase
VNELLTNSFKYAFGGRGTGVISVECLRKGEKRYRIVVRTMEQASPKA